MLAESPTLQAYVAMTVVLGFNLLALANNTALTRAKAAEVVNPEDKRLNAKAEVVFEGGNEKTARYRRAHRNALENIPLFLITGFLLSLTAVPFGLAAGLFGVFTVARLLHSVCYVKGIQPWRTAGFAIGALAQLGVLGYLAYAVATA
ncbi:MAG: MAPEG family protein [Myxococcales bacterium]|nr:MAPEG family protein [Myxococcales bacterium]